jgi:single-stranded-DNA-specific exonuclease
MPIKNLKKASNRILKAVKNKEKIIIFSDSDLDGVVSAILMEETIKNLGGNIIEVYFPNREKEGYGISEKALLNLKKHAPAILIATDLGVGNIKEVIIAKKLKIEVIIIDHHEVLEKVPSPAIVVDPKQKGDNYPFKNFAACGLVFLLSKELLKDKMGRSLEKSFLELVAIATIADMMPIKEDNLFFVSNGLSSIENTWRPGLKTLFNIENSESLNLMQRISKINSLLNIRDNEEKSPIAYKILTSLSEEESIILSKDLISRNLEKKREIERIKEEIEEKIKNKKESIIFEGDISWDTVLMGSVAGSLAQKYQKPVFLYKEIEGECLGGIRSSSGFNVVEAMKGFKDFLITYGGHPQAAGFRIKKENIEKFREYLLKYFKLLKKLQYIHMEHLE